jgi:hypothetical protein
MRPAKILALGIVVTVLVGSAAGDTMSKSLDNQTCMMLQQSSMGDCQDNRAMTDQVRMDLCEHLIEKSHGTALTNKKEAFLI